MTGRVRLLVLVLLPVLVLTLGVWWAGSQGYVPPIWEGEVGCGDQGWSPPPSFDDLVETYGESPYCARRVRDETWL